MDYTVELADACNNYACVKIPIVANNKIEMPPVGEGANAISATVSGDGITRNVNVVPDGGEDVVGHESVVLVPVPRTLAGVPLQLRDWQYLTSLTVDGTAATAGLQLSPYGLMMGLDYVKRVLTGRPLGKMCVELRFSAQPTAYHYGVVVAAWLPSESQRPTVWKNATSKASAAYTMSRKHSVRIDLAKPTVVTLKCPLVSQYGPVWPMTTGGLPDWANTSGKVYLNSMTGNLYRQDGAFTSFAIEVMGRFTEDSEMYGLTSSVFYPVSARYEGPLSSVLGAARDGFGAAAKSAGGKFAGFLDPLRAVASMGADIARAVGLGVPYLPQVGEKVFKSTGGAPFNADTQNVADGMGLSAVAARAVHQAGSDEAIDEASIANIVSRYGLVTTFTVAAADALGLTYTPIAVSPSYMTLTLPNNPPTAVAWVAAMHGFWRGGLTYRVSVVASKYHSGRIRVTYEPDAWFDTTSAPTIASLTHNFSEVFDIAEGVVVEFTVPWTSAHPWLLCREYPASTLPGTSTNYEDREYDNGYLLFTLESPLASVAAAPSSVFLVVEVKGADDFEVAVPSPHECGLITVSAKVGAEAVVKPRVLGEGVTYNEAAKAFMGERVTSARQLVKVMQPLGGLCEPGTAVVTADKQWSRVFEIWPWVNDDRMSGVVVDATQLGSPAHPLIYWRRAFGCVSGGVRWRLTRGPINGYDSLLTQLGQNASYGPVAVAGEYWDKDVAATSTKPYAGVLWDTTGAANAVATLQKMMLTRPYKIQNLNDGALEFTVPMRGVAIGVPGFVSVIGGATQGSVQSGYALGVTWQGGNALSVGMVLSAGAADDYNMSYYDGPPFCQTLNV